MNAPKEEMTESESSAPDLETEVDEAIRICGGDVRAGIAGNARRKFISGR
jgi:hypothetical protein